MDNLIEYYCKLLIIQYRQQPKAKATIAAIIRLILADLILLKIKDAFNVDTAIGAQLDIIAKYLGTRRQQTGFIFNRQYFNYAEYNGSSYTLNGLNTYDNPTAYNTPFLTYKEFESSLFDLTDEELRTIVKFLIAKNTGYPSTKDITEVCYNFLCNEIRVFDNQDMTLTYYLSKNNSLIANVLAKNDYLPRPLGVGIDVILIMPQVDNIFSYSDYEKGVSNNSSGYQTYDDYVQSKPYITYKNALKVA
ncbi:MAG: DUF2612 domain-containing protein [Elusimicrobiota bacterium]|jgi:hypothetical protein|nr:DUF2612 domain-containing protein [Elusimicrobiota bacterium]